MMSAVDVGEREFHTSATSSSGISPMYPLTRRLVVPRACPDALEKRRIFCFRWDSNPDSSVVHRLAWSLYRLNYPGFSLLLGSGLVLPLTDGP
jgi:hypothetical protein